LAARRDPLADLADVDEVLAEDPPRLREDVGRICIALDRRNEIQVRRDAADGNGPTEELADPLLEHRPAALQGVLEKRLALWKAERDDIALDTDRPTCCDQRLGRRVLADVGDDLGPEGTQLVESLGAGTGADGDWRG
jgi:hypothetical protein